MGDRANIRLEFGPKPGQGITDAATGIHHMPQNYEPIFIYAHWDGRGGLARKLAAALASPEGRSRRGDESYLARIIFEHVIRGAYSLETGYGIAPYRPDENHSDIVVDLVRGTVDGLTFDEFIAEHAEVKS